MTATTIRVRPAIPAEEDAVRQLFAALHAHNALLDPRFALAEGWPELLHEHLTHVWQTGHGLSLLAWDGSTAVGLALLSSHSDSPLFLHRHWAELVALYVEPAVRGSGVADQLLAEGLAWARQQGYARVQLYVTVSNQPARHFYARNGFLPVQEVWRHELGPAPASPPVATEHAAGYAYGHDLLTISSHTLAGDPYRESHPAVEEALMLPINPLGATRHQPNPHAAIIKDWVANTFALPDTTTVLVTELRCQEEGCPPLETVIAILDSPGIQRQFKLYKALHSVTADDIAALALPTDDAP